MVMPHSACGWIRRAPSVRWDARRSKADLNIVCDIPYRGSRTAVLQKVDLTADGKGGVKIRHARNKPSDTTTSNTSALLVNTGCGRIVGAPNFPRRSSRGEEEGEAEKDEGAEEQRDKEEGGE